LGTKVLIRNTLVEFIEEMNVCMKGKTMDCPVWQEDLPIFYRIVIMVERGIGWP
jgi:hypothetical protein